MRRNIYPESQVQTVVFSKVSFPSTKCELPVLLTRNVKRKSCRNKTKRNETTEMRQNENEKIFNFEVLASGKTDKHCKIKETLLIQKFKPALNVNISSDKLFLFRTFLFLLIFEFIILNLTIYTFDNGCWILRNVKLL